MLKSIQGKTSDFEEEVSYPYAVGEESNGVNVFFRVLTLEEMREGKIAPHEVQRHLQPGRKVKIAKGIKKFFEIRDNGYAHTSSLVAVPPIEIAVEMDGEYIERGEILDGNGRFNACLANHVGVPAILYEGLTEEEKIEIFCSRQKVTHDTSAHIFFLLCKTDEKYRTIDRIYSKVIPNWKGREDTETKKIEQTNVSVQHFVNAIFIAQNKVFSMSKASIQRAYNELSLPEITQKAKFAAKCFEIMNDAIPYKDHLEGQKWSPKTKKAVPNFWTQTNIFAASLRFVGLALNRLGDTDQTKKKIVDFLKDYQGFLSSWSFANTFGDIAKNDDIYTSHMVENFNATQKKLSHRLPYCENYHYTLEHFGTDKKAFKKNNVAL